MLVKLKFKPHAVADPEFPVGEGGAKPLGGADLQRGHFSAKRYVKTKELDPVGGGAHAGSTPWICQCHVQKLILYALIIYQDQHGDML